jgi:hypothetical protein
MVVSGKSKSTQFLYARFCLASLADSPPEPVGGVSSPTPDNGANCKAFGAASQGADPHGRAGNPRQEDDFPPGDSWAPLRPNFALVRTPP